jgi:hypothetical protein
VLTTDDCESTDQRINCACARATAAAPDAPLRQRLLALPDICPTELLRLHRRPPRADLRLHYCEVVAKHRSEPLAIILLLLWMVRGVRHLFPPLFMR